MAQRREHRRAQLSRLVRHRRGAGRRDQLPVRRRSRMAGAGRAQSRRVLDAVRAQWQARRRLHDVFRHRRRRAADLDVRPGNADVGERRAGARVDRRQRDRRRAGPERGVPDGVHRQSGRSRRRLGQGSRLPNGVAA